MPQAALLEYQAPQADQPTGALRWLLIYCIILGAMCLMDFGVNFKERVSDLQKARWLFASHYRPFVLSELKALGAFAAAVGRMVLVGIGALAMGQLLLGRERCRLGGAWWFLAALMVVECFTEGAATAFWDNATLSGNQSLGVAGNPAREAFLRSEALMAFVWAITASVTRIFVPILIIGYHNVQHHPAKTLGYIMRVVATAYVANVFRIKVLSDYYSDTEIWGHPIGQAQWILTGWPLAKAALGVVVYGGWIFASFLALRNVAGARATMICLAVAAIILTLMDWQETYYNLTAGLGFYLPVSGILMEIERKAVPTLIEMGPPIGILIMLWIRTRPKEIA